ncbi:MAG TPA: tRNA (guanosine(46)-N7)-methyltransferase TrmB [Gammaproteobacteria bacterium]
MDNRPLRTVRSFVRRQGRLTLGQQRALDNLWPLYGIEYQEQLLDLNSLFGREADTILEIGFGNGDSLFQMAEKNPQNNYIGIEVHRPGIGHLLQLIEQSSVKNIRIVCHDAVDVLKLQIPDHSLVRLQLFFPDPWHKKKHHKRRIVQHDFVNLVAQKLGHGGLFHLATDWEDYAKHMLQVLTASNVFNNLSPQNDFVERPKERPVTKFEQRGHRLGHGVWDLLFKRA